MAHVLRVVAPITNPPSGPPLPPSTPPLYILAVDGMTSCESTCASAGRVCNSLGSVGLDCGIPASYLERNYTAPGCYESNCPLDTQIGPEGIASCNFAYAYKFADTGSWVPFCAGDPAAAGFLDEPIPVLPACSASSEYDYGRRWCCHCGDSVPTS